MGKPTCYGKMYDPEPTDACMTCDAFNKCKEIEWGHPDQELTSVKVPMEHATILSPRSRW